MTKGAIMNVKRQICQEGICHELTQVASPQPAGKPLISHSAHHNLPFFEEISQCFGPLKNGVIALWPNTRVVKCEYYVSQKQNGFNNKIHWSSILLTFKFKFAARLWWTKICYSVISVIVDSLPDNTKNQESTCSWMARVRLFHPCAAWNNRRARRRFESKRFKITVQESPLRLMSAHTKIQNVSKLRYKNLHSDWCLPIPN